MRRPCGYFGTDRRFGRGPVAGVVFATLLAGSAGGAHLPGQIVVDPDNPQWLKRHGGDHVFVCGPGDPEGFLYRSDQDALIDKLIANGGNCIYMQIVRSHGGDGASSENPFVGHDPRRGVDGRVLDRWEKWFARMDDAGILIYLFFYDDGARPFGRGEDVTDAEEAFIEAVVNRFEHHRDLIWLVAEESEEAYTHTRVRNVAAKIRHYDDDDHIIGNHHLSGTTFKAWAKGTALSHYSMQCTGKTGDVHARGIEARKKAESSGNGYFVIYSESTSSRGNDGNDIRRHMWNIAMAGVQPMRLGMDIAGTGTDTLKQCRYLQAFFEGTDFYTMSNHDELRHAGTTYVLADPGHSYIAYAENLSGEVGIRRMTSGTYTLTWLDCVSGTTVTQRNVTVAGGDRSFPRPRGVGEQCAVWIKRGGAGASAVIPE